MCQIDLFVSDIVVSAGDDRFSLIQLFQVIRIFPVPDLTLFQSFKTIPCVGSIDQIKDLYSSPFHVLNFPAGACSRLQRIDGHWQIRDLEWHKNFIQRAGEYQRDVVPIYFEGRNSRFFYTLAFLRKLLGIKLNIEMLYLVDEMYGAHGKHFRVHVLPPLSYTIFDNSRTPKQWAEYVKSIVYESNNSSR